MNNSDSKHVGEIYVFPFVECSPDQLRVHPEQDLFVVYHTSGLPSLCSWKDDAFWYKDENTGKMEIVMHAEYWFRIPRVEEVVTGKEEEVASEV